MRERLNNQARAKKIPTDPAPAKAAAGFFVHVSGPGTGHEE
jgi:hypothetical protein